MTPTNRWILTLAVGLLGIGVVGVAVSDSDDDDRDGRHAWRDGWVEERPDVAPVTNPRYAEECGACHMAYQPGLLPATAWAAIMTPAALADHYGEDASLADGPRRELADYLAAHAAEHSGMKRSQAFAVTSGAASSARLPRITDTPYFLRKHDEIPARMVADNPEVGGFSQCNSCHRGAADGLYDDDHVRIPGFGRWED